MRIRHNERIYVEIRKLYPYLFCSLLIILYFCSTEIQYYTNNESETIRQMGWWQDTTH